MNNRKFNSDADFYSFEPPWYFEGYNALKRIFELKAGFDRIFSSLNELKEMKEDLDEGDVNPKNIVDDFEIAVGTAIEELEVFYYCFSDIGTEEWFYSLWQALAGAHWRAEKGRFFDKPSSIYYRLSKIVDHVPNGQEPGPFTNLTRFIESQGRQINSSEVDALFENDVYEAQDHIALGYYSTALLVLGRAVEKALLEIGRQAKVQRIKKNHTISWEKATFYDRTEALTNADHPKGTGKIISRKQYLEISILIDYRNNVAHTDYEDIGREEAVRMSESAVDLLNQLSTILEGIQKMDDEEIKALTIKVN